MKEVLEQGTEAVTVIGRLLNNAHDRGRRAPPLTISTNT
jgi:hypothetical protein